MAVFRVNKTNDYTIMSNNHFREKEMSLKAKGLLSLMLSLPDDWDYSISGLVAISKDGKDSVMNALNELEEMGYVKKTMLKDSKGKFDGYNYDIYEVPYSEKPYAENPKTGKPNTEKPYAENPPQLNTKQSNTKELNTKQIKHIYGEYGRIRLTDAEYEKLVKDYGKELIDRQIEKLDEYVESNNNKNRYTNFNLVLRRSIKQKWFKGEEDGTDKQSDTCTGYEEFNER